MARRLNIAKSLLVVKFFFRLLTKTENTELLINFFQLSSEEFLALCQHYSLSQCGFAAPFANNFKFLSQLCDITLDSLSNGNLHTPLEAWISSQDGNKILEKNALTALTGTDEGPIDGIKTLAGWIKKAISFFETKISLAEDLRTAAFESDQKGEEIHDVVNKVITKLIKKEDAIKKVEAYLTSIKVLGEKTIVFLNQEPEEEAFNVCNLTHGTNGFLNDLNLLTPQVIVDKLRRRPLDVVVLVNHVAKNLEHIPALNQLYINVMQTFATLKGLQDKEEECQSQVNRLTKLLVKETREFIGEVFGEEGIHTSPSMILELIKDGEDLKKKRSHILSLTDDPIDFGQFNITLNGRVKILSIEELFKVTKRILLTKKDELIEAKKFQEIKARTVLQENLKTLPKVELLGL